MFLKKLLCLGLLFCSTLSYSQQEYKHSIEIKRFNFKSFDSLCANKVLSTNLNNILLNKNALAFKMALNENHPTIKKILNVEPIIHYHSKEDTVNSLYALLNYENRYIYRNGKDWSMWELIHDKMIQDCFVK